MLRYIGYVKNWPLLDPSKGSSTLGTLDMPSGMWIRKNSLRRKVIGAYISGVVLSILLSGAGLLLLVQHSSDILDWRVSKQASELAGRIQFDEAGRPSGVTPSDEGLDWIYQSFKEDLAYRIIDTSGAVVLYSAAGEPFWPTLETISRPSARGLFMFERDGTVFHGASEPIRSGSQLWFLQYAGSARMADLFQVEFGLPLVGMAVVLFSLVLLVIFGGCSYITLRKTLKPLHEISASAAAISPRSLDSRLVTDGVPAEVAPLVNSFNHTLDRLEHGFRVQQEFLGATAHELKTPLALIRAQIELKEPDDDRDTLLQDVVHMTRQVQQLLLLAEASESQNYHLLPVDVLDVVQEAAQYLQRMAKAADVQLELNSEVTPSWLADRGALFTLLKNLLENAIQHSPPGTVVSIEVDNTTLTVRDRGSGADDEQLSMMFARYWRGRHRRDQGAGLGLAICREIADFHGWSLSAKRAEPGLLFQLTQINAQKN